MPKLTAFVALMLVGCATASRIHTEPEGATLYIDGLLMGETPFVFHNDPGLPRRYHVQIAKPGFEPLDFYIDTRMSWLWGYVGLVTLVPYLWAWSLSGDYVFALTPMHDDDDAWHQPHRQEAPEPEVAPEPEAEPDEVRL